MNLDSIKNLDLEICRLNTVPDLTLAPSFDSAVHIETNTNSSNRWIRIQTVDFYPTEKKTETVSYRFRYYCY